MKKMLKGWPYPVIKVEVSTDTICVDHRGGDLFQIKNASSSALLLLPSSSLTIENNNWKKNLPVVALSLLPCCMMLVAMVALCDLHLHLLVACGCARGDVANIRHGIVEPHL